MSVIVVAAWVASALVFSSFFMKTMVPLRMVAIASNVAFICYALLGLESGIFAKVYPILVLHSCLLPLNVLRLAQIRRLMRAARSSTDSDLIALLVPFMKRETHPGGTVLFFSGDAADSLYLVARTIATKTIVMSNEFRTRGSIPGATRSEIIARSSACEATRIIPSANASTETLRPDAGIAQDPRTRSARARARNGPRGHSQAAA